MYLGLKRSSASLIMLFGIGLYIFGLILMCDRFLLLVGNIIFLCGAGSSAGCLTLTMFFIKPSKLKGSISYFIGFFLLLMNWALIGGLIQLIGIFYLFRDFIPQIYASSKYIPGIGPYISSSTTIRDIVAYISGNSKMNTV